MSRTVAQSIVLDTTVLSNFASSETVDHLTRSITRPVTVPAVQKELTQGRDHGHQFLDDALAHVSRTIPLLTISEETNTTFTEIRERLDEGEPESLLGAIEHDATLATDDLAARRIAAEYDIPGYNNLSPEERDRWKAHIAQELGKPKTHVTPTDWEAINNDWKIPSLIRTTRAAGWRPALIEKMQVDWYDSTTQTISIPEGEAIKNDAAWDQELGEEAALTLDY